MKISQYIAELERVQSEHGDLEVETRSIDGRRFAAPTPEIAYRKILNKRESRDEFWYPYCGAEESKGEKVCKV